MTHDITHVQPSLYFRICMLLLDLQSHLLKLTKYRRLTPQPPQPPLHPPPGSIPTAPYFVVLYKKKRHYTPAWRFQVSTSIAIMRRGTVVEYVVMTKRTDPEQPRSLNIASDEERRKPWPHTAICHFIQMTVNFLHHFPFMTFSLNGH